MRTLGVVVTKPISSVPLFSDFLWLSKHKLAIEYRVYIWQVSQLSCGDTCQIWMWFKESNRYFYKIENFAYGEINKRSFSNPHPSSQMTDNVEKSFRSNMSFLCHVFAVVQLMPVMYIYIYIKGNLYRGFNSSRPSDAYMCHDTRTPMVQLIFGVKPLSEPVRAYC